ncbi:MAG: hypothetical protein ACQXXH_03475 [Candidatus Bathyarchaeia archaeon]|jgi:hypothetical protein|nr:hypothetical protein [Candidatus Bathyarchaeota archaeon A05DMB-4]MDH7594800.1 hypothetical protein [Candidatus Bathyarchaeota archaeon]
MEQNENRISMKGNDFRLIGYIGTALGVFFLIGGLTAAVYYKEYHTGAGFDYVVREYPYEKYAVNLFVAGAVLLTVGLTFFWRAKREQPTQKGTTLGFLFGS